MKLAYFVHDLTEPAVRRRVRMLKAGGADPIVLGFRRAETPPEEIDGQPAIDLGRTYDARLGHRARQTVRAALGAGRLKLRLAECEAVMARSLEMLSVAQAARTRSGLRVPLAYECLDIHRLMLGQGLKSRAMRAVERALLARADLLIISSPAFLEAYFAPRQGVGERLSVPTLLVENKALELDGPVAAAPRLAPPPAGPPWRIGWMGAIRCRRSLSILMRLAERRPDLVEVTLHGRPAYTEFDDFDAEVRRLRNLRFGGPYSAEQLPLLYGRVHFAWAIDYMEEGLNSSWLLPNRLYEASRHGALPIALAEVQTGRFLADRGYGVRLTSPDALEGFLDGLTVERYAALRQELAAQPAEAFIADAADCRALVRAIAGGQRPVGREDDGAPKAKLVA